VKLAMAAARGDDANEIWWSNFIKKENFIVDLNR
jgi:hypothetical protein